MNKWFQIFLTTAFVLPCSLLMAQKTCQQQKLQCNPNSNLIGVYFGGFGGWIFPSDTDVIQMGTAFYPEDAGGPLDVMAKGTAPGSTQGFGGVHLGYEWMKQVSSGFRLAPAFELEGTYFTNTAGNADIVNPTERLDAHEFIDTFPMRIGSLLANGILEFNNDYISPYIGFGVGAGFVSIHGANCLQIDFMEPGINHFNTNPNDFKTLFATQAKAGIRYRFLKHYRLSAEYRFFYLTSSDFTFGSTMYPDHVPTSPWIVKLSSMFYNAFSLGIDFIF